MPIRITSLNEEVVDVVLRTGQRLLVRPIRSDDKKRLEEFFYRLSEWSRYLRFGYAKKQITDAELTYYTEVEWPRAVAYIATMGEREHERIVAVGRWFMMAGGKTAEIAFAVEDNIQVRGIGTALLEQLASAATRYRVSRFVARVIPENTRMIEVLEESGFKFQKVFDEGTYEYTIDLSEQEEFAKRQAYREHVARSAGVAKVLYPGTVAVVGASRNPESVGGAIFRNLLANGFRGVAFPVNPNAISVAGVLAYPSVLNVPGDIDLAVIAVPAPLVLDVVEECGQRGIGGLVIISAGFSEAGGEGKERQRRLLEKVLSYGMRVIGPNCLGILNCNPEVSLNATFSPTAPPCGKISIGSQSGALGLALLDYARSMSLGISNFVSIGNRMDISNNDLLEFWEDDPNTDIIVLYMESFGNPRKFSRIARRVSRKKPVIVVRGGKSEVGARAATSHTGALAASEVAVDAMFRQAGVIRVDSIEEMFNVTKFLSGQPLPAGPNVGILTNAGGPGVLAADAAAGWGLKVPPLSGATIGRLGEFLPEAAALGNPVDMIASAPAASYARAMTAMLEDPAIDALMVIYIPPLVTRPEDVASAVRETMRSYTGRKPVIACFMTMKMPATSLVIVPETEIPLAPGGEKTGPKGAVPLYLFPEDGIEALARAYQYARFRKTEEGTAPKFSGLDKDAAGRLVSEAVKAAPPSGAWMMPEDGVALLGFYGIPSADTRIAFTPEEAAEKAARLGFPVALKLRSSTITHKTDVNGVALDLRSEDEVKESFNLMQRSLPEAGHPGEMQGVILQPMIFGGQEVILGMTIDPTFGPLVMVGLGGIQVELMKDVSFSLHPLTSLDPERMLAGLKSLPLLKGWRGRPPRDMRALAGAILRFSVLIEDFPEIEQMEINPLVVFDEGKGCAAVDTRIFIRAIA
ncbi:MAG: GNAT family N-acetyltransferase [Nitrospiraceae bacterium]|nr:GNAT family N-acetyltransferase [Nitrospiraceae bacterium]